MADQQAITDEQNLAFELLSLAGDVESFRVLEGELQIDSEQCSKLRGRAELYFLVREMLGNQLESSILAEAFDQYESLAEYAKQSSDPMDAQALLKVLDEVINMSMETYAQLDAVSIFSKAPVLQCIKNNLTDPHVKEGLQRFVETAYTRIFCTHDVYKEHVDEYFPVIDEWRDLVDPKKIVKSAIEDIYDLTECSGYDSESTGAKVSEDFECVIKKQMEMTSREYVSTTYFKYHSESDAYNSLIQSGLIDDCAEVEETNQEVGLASRKTAKAIRGYERDSLWVSEFEVKKLAEGMGKDGADHLALAIGRWLEDGRLALIKPLFDLETAPACNIPLARKLVTKVLKNTIQEGEVVLLAKALDLPAELVDASVPELAGFRLAHTVRQAGTMHVNTSDQVAVENQEGTKKELQKPADPLAKASTKGGRKFVKIELDQFKKKVEAAFAKQDPANPRELTSRVAKDLSKVDFSLENIDWDESFRPELLGFHQLDNGFCFLGVQAGGDWEFPVFFIVYWDGKALRGYIPTNGNPWNTDTKSAYGNDEERDLANAKKRFPGMFDDVDYLDTGDFSFNVNEILEDIKSRIIEK